MYPRFLTGGIAAVCIAGAISVCAPDASASDNGKANGQGWTANGATACERFLTADVLTAILVKPVGPAVRLDATSCHTDNIYITLRVDSIEAFRLKLPRIAGTHPLAGVGDGAYWNGAGALSAVKGHDRGCDIAVIAGAKIHDEALGKKLGEICNKLFALN